MKHDYTPQQALELLTRKLTTRDPELAAQVLAAVNAGKDVQEVERNGKKSSRFYRHTVPNTPAEALQVALEVLRAHFIEQPLCINSCHDNMAKADIGVRRAELSVLPKQEVVHAEVKDTEKTIEIELQTETEIIAAENALPEGSKQTLIMSRIPSVEVKEEQNRFDHLRALVDFTEN